MRNTILSYKKPTAFLTVEMAVPIINAAVNYSDNGSKKKVLIGGVYKDAISAQAVQFGRRQFLNDCGFGEQRIKDVTMYFQNLLTGCFEVPENEAAVLSKFAPQILGARSDKSENGRQIVTLGQNGISNILDVLLDNKDVLLSDNTTAVNEVIATAAKVFPEVERLPLSIALSGRYAPAGSNYAEVISSRYARAWYSASESAKDLEYMTFTTNDCNGVAALINQREKFNDVFFAFEAYDINQVVRNLTKYNKYDTRELKQQINTAFEYLLSDILHPKFKNGKSLNYSSFSPIAVGVTVTTVMPEDMSIVLTDYTEEKNRENGQYNKIIVNDFETMFNGTLSSFDGIAGRSCSYSKLIKNVSETGEVLIDGTYNREVSDTIKELTKKNGYIDKVVDEYVEFCGKD